MTVINRYTGNIRGSVIMFGNSLGVSNTDNSISLQAFTVANVDPPGGSTTTDWTQNSSAVIVQIPATATIKYAEFCWSGNSKNTYGTIDANISVSLIDPNGTTHTINPDPTTYQTYTTGNNIYYTHSVNITSIIQNTRNGKYTAKRIPGLLGDDITHLGFVIIIIYEDANENFRNINLWATNEYLITATDIDITGFSTPITGAVNAKFIIASNGGQPNIYGESVKIGPNPSSLFTISGPNNPASNFFCSQINNNDGLLDTTGTLGNNNSSLTGPLYVTAGNRINYDCTRVDVSSAFSNNQTSARISLSSMGDIEAINIIALQIDINSANFQIVSATVDKNSCNPGQELTYTTSFKNTGLADAENVKFITTIPQGTSFVSNSLTINGISSTSTPTSPGIPLGTLLTNILTTITYKLTVDSVPTTNPFTNTASITYQFVSGAGIPPESTVSNINYPAVNVIPFVDTLETTVSLSKEYADIGDIVNYTCTVKNTGNISVSNVILQVTIPNQAVFSTGTVSLNGALLPSANPTTGINVGLINVNQLITVTFSATIST